MDIERLLRDSWEKYLKEIIQLVLFTLVGGFLCIFIITIPAVMKGFVVGFLGYVRDGRKPEFSDLWSHWDKFIPIVLLLIVMGILTAIGFALLIVPGVYLTVVWFYALFYLVDKDMGYWKAMGASRDAVMQSGFINHLVIVLIAWVLNALGSAAAGIGALFTAPFALILISHAYIEISGSESGNPMDVLTQPPKVS